MKLLVLGGTGRTGSQIIAQAIAGDDTVVALTRHPDIGAVKNSRLEWVVGDATEQVALTAVLDGVDAVLCALGTPIERSFLPTDLMRATVDALVPAMSERGVTRVVLLSALGVGRSAAYAPNSFRLAFRTLGRAIETDKDRAEEALAASDLDWTIVYPPLLTDGPRTGGYRHGEALALHAIPRIARGDVADFMLAQVHDPHYRRRIAIIGPGEVT
ncbi:NAD(P)-dependent oxidoreductase [Mycolicibacterium komossense]|uniref:NAD(P)H-binding protein n=1 Tax=Mycolicibacterium komossense TaxID=1779 RepID=A0ABT3CAY2_9MYCO|nr:NAD(P)H-binding protein [Mycolicibacterium komossense]MCV7226630.1 NAD(P)H-binding protein [Mycolicibacterium komossense]